MNKLKMDASKVRLLVTVGVYVLMLAVFMVLAPGVFMGYRIYMAFLVTVPVALLMSLGATFVAISGEIDLSFPGVLCMSAFIFAITLITTGNQVLAVLAGLISGIVMGALNGFIVTKIGIPSIITTLAAQFVWLGTALVVSQAKSLELGFVRELPIWDIFVGRIGGVFPAQALWALGIAIVLGLLLNRHRFGDSVIFAGDNREAARMLGINTHKVMIQVFALMGLLSAAAGILITLEMATWWPIVGPGYLLPVLAAVFVGGTQGRGEGTILGTVVGAFIMGTMVTGIVAAGVDAFWVQFLQGSILISAVFLNRYLRAKAARSL